eukprot:m.127782 g.127782  ORF g.127782 m.127782 type:complete len:78 (+) comp22257_c1_seq2:1171-1404(+)
MPVSGVQAPDSTRAGASRVSGCCCPAKGLVASDLKGSCPDIGGAPGLVALDPLLAVCCSALVSVSFKRGAVGGCGGC